MERQWSPVGEGLCGLHDARHTDQVFVAAQQGSLIPKQAMAIVQKHDAKWL